uniref:glutamate-1-semialdehyde 2,1-aminomutase n=2 Tax=Polytomella TaxID=3049 RepID=A0A7S0VNN4_9CHLO|nr:glutamate 1-semialdehyde aminotransferase [Polytomella sp. Pringsheim 198.80]|mmetsp:Transcript_80/g.112  ORF Transcript_80/g.112 Transcript_80/m.112 type:complete len:481 (+) Transcript_80:128-1570(+)
MLSFKSDTSIFSGRKGPCANLFPPVSRKLNNAKPILMKAASKLVTTKSEEIFNEALELLPGGVNSPVRAFRSVGGKPIVFSKVKGARCYDVDGNSFLDYVGSWGPAIVGHAHDEVNAAIIDQVSRGTSFGAPGPLENELAKVVISRVPAVEMVRFVSSGTEACLSVLRLMRAATGRDGLIKFAGCYHGHADSFLVKAGSGVATLGLPDSPGVPASTTASTFTATFNDLDSVEKIFAAHPTEIAGIIVEPVVGNGGFIPPSPTFLRGLRALCDKYKALLCFDEVMTGFRVHKNCAQKLFGVTPDLVTLGKVIGGGLPVGAYGGRKDLMLHVAPAGTMYQAGTLSGNPLAMAAGLKTLEILDRPGAYEHLDRISKKLVEGVVAAGRAAGHPLVGGSFGGMFGFFLLKQEELGKEVEKKAPQSFEEAQSRADTAKFARFHRLMLEEGVYLAPSQFEAGFTSLAHTDEDIEFTISAAANAFKRL